MCCSAGWSTTGRTRLGRFIDPSSSGMTWELVGVGMRSTSWMRPGSPRRLLGICLLGGVFLVVFVRHLFLGDLFLLFSFSLFVVSVLSCLVGSPFSFYCYMLCDHCGLSWVLGSGSLGGFLLVFLVLGKIGFSFVSFVVISGLCCLYLFVLNILSCYQVGSLVRLC